ncbi:MAG: glucosamine-6-phosphate deaminase [Clostridia bacterium]|nr:glucosamine-6-phosphate deaminase [Clostridia bacterium]
MEIIITKNYDELSEKASKIMLDVIKNNPSAVIGLATGTSPLGLYNNLIKDHKENGTSYKDIKTVNLDEYMGLDISSNQSYVYFMRENLFNHLDINLNNTHIENGKAEDPAKECERYNNLLHSLKQDIQLLGIGSDGHIAFNEPNTPFGSETHIADLTESTIKDNSRLFNSIDEVPTKAYTMGLKNIMNAKKILIIANGKNKAKAVSDMVNGKITEEVPASILQLHPNCTLIVDEDAGSLL